MYYLEPSPDDVAALIEVSRGSAPADLYIRGGTVANVYSGEYLRANIAVKNGRIAYVGLGEESVGDNTQVIDASGKYVCPGYVEVHAHPWAMYNPVENCRAILPLGTTSVFFDTLFFLLLMEDPAFEKLLAGVTTLPLNVFWSVRIAPQSTMADEGTRFNVERVRRYLELPNIVGVFEITRWPELLEGNPRYLERIADARRLGKRVDGHTAGCSYEKLNPVVAAGADSCHEPIDAQQALDRLRLGMYVFLRDSSLREDLRELIQIVTKHKVYTGRLALTTDGPSPQYFADKGSVEYLADVAVESGVDPMAALQMITINPATYFHLDHRVGGIAPGRMADIVINPRADRFKPETVIAGGHVVARDGELVEKFPDFDWANCPFDHPQLPADVRIRPEHLMVPAADAHPTFPVMDLVSAVITRRRDLELPVAGNFVDISGIDGMHFITLLDRHGAWASNGIIKGFARDIEGLATSYTTSCHVVVLGKSGEAMATAANRLYELGGGIVLVEDGKIIYEMPLELGGTMSAKPFEVTVRESKRIVELLDRRGHPYGDVLYTMLFLSCDFLPEVRVTLAGVYDVKARQALRSSRKIAELPS